MVNSTLGILLANMLMLDDLCAHMSFQWDIINCYVLETWLNSGQIEELKGLHFTGDVTLPFSISFDNQIDRLKKSMLQFLLEIYR